MFLFILLLQEEIPNPSSNFLINQTSMNDFGVQPRVGGGAAGADELSRPPVINRRERLIN